MHKEKLSKVSRRTVVIIGLKKFPNIFNTWSYVEAFLSHNGHIEMVYEGQLQSLAPLVVVRVVEGLDVEQHRVAVVFPSLRALKDRIGLDRLIPTCAINSLTQFPMQCRHATKLLLLLFEGRNFSVRLANLNFRSEIVPMSI